MTPADRHPAHGFDDPSARSGEMPRGEKVSLQAHASDRARIYQAYRDMIVAERDIHLHLQDGVRERRRVLTASVSDECPYPGLASFGTDQARWFFGRDDLVAKLLVRADASLAMGGALVVVAPSGAGKTSLLRAGLMAELEQGVLPGSADWPQVWLTPTSHPMEALGAHLWEVMDSGPDGSPVLRPEELRRALAKRPGERRVVLVVDQLEELFTLCPDKQERRDFLDAVLGVAQAGPGGEPPPGLVVFGLRSDFYTQCAAHRGLLDAVERNQVMVGPLSRTGVREAILFPARAAGLDVEPGLVQVLLRDLGATEGGADDAAYEIGRLPLLAHALRATWLRRAGHVLTVEGYEATGGIANSVTTEADRWFGRLDPSAQETAQYVFLRLVKFGERGTGDTRRPVPYDELVSHCARPEEAAQVVEKFTLGRLLTREQNTVTITHEILLRAWPRLRQWIREHRAQYLARQRLEDAALAWQEAGRDPGMLYRGGRLEEARALATGDGEDDGDGTHRLGPVASEFLTASVRHRQRVRRIWQGVVACLSVLAVLVAASAVVASHEKDTAKHQRNAAILGEIEAKADQLRSTDASLAAQLDLVAHRMDPNPSTEMNLVSAQNQTLSTVLPGYKNEVDAVEFSPDGRMLATGDAKGVIRLWNTARTGHPTALGHPLHGFRKRIWQFVFSRDGHFLTAAGEDGTIRLWDIGDPSRPTGLGEPIKAGAGSLYTLALSPDGRVLAAAGHDGRIRMWDVTDPRYAKSLGTPLNGVDGEMLGIAFSPDGKLLAGGGDDGTVRLWRVTNGRHPSYAGEVPQRVPTWQGVPGSVQWVAFSPDSRELAAAGSDNSAHLWDVTNPGKPAPISALGTNDTVDTVEFSRSGHLLAFGGDDSIVWLCNVTSPRDAYNLTPPLMGHTGKVEALAFNPKGTVLATASADRTVRLWTVPPTVLTGHTDFVGTTDLSHDGHLLASGSEDGTVRLWDVARPADPRPVSAVIRSHGQPIDTVAFRPHGKVLAVSAGSHLQLWDVTEPARPKLLGSPPLRSKDGFPTIAFSADGNTLAGGTPGGQVDLWNVSDPSHPTPLGRPLATHTDDRIDDVAFSPDGHTLAAAIGNGDLRLWDVTHPAGPRERARLNVSEQALESVVFGPGGRTLVTSGDDATIRLWDVTDRTHPRRLGPALTGHISRVMTLALSPDGRTLASGGSDQTIQLWDVGDPAHARPHGGPVTGLFEYVNAIVFSRDGRRIFIGTGDYDERILPLTIQTATDYICRSTGNLLTPELWHKYIPHHAYDPPCARS